MEWTPGGVSQDVEDRRGGGGFRMGGLGGPHLGIGGAVVLLILSFVFHRNLFTMFSADTSDPSSVVARDPSANLPASQDPAVQFVSFVLDDVQKTWETLLPQQASRPYRHAKLVLFTDETESGCGDAQAAQRDRCGDDRLVRHCHALLRHAEGASGPAQPAGRARRHHGLSHRRPCC